MYAPFSRAYFEFVTYGGAAYAIAGHNGGEHNKVDRWTEKEGWVTMANYPQVMHRGCCVADEGNDRIYCMGGYYHRNAYQYIVSTNTWQSMSWDSSMYYSSYDIGCAIITNKGNGNRLIVAAGSHRSSTQYIDITAGGQWKSSDGLTSWNRGRLISVSPYEAYMVSHRNQK